MENKARGSYGEDLAALFLQRSGYQIIVRNLKSSYQEIDIIARQDKMTVFVEVKYRTNDKLGPARDALNHSKIRNMKRAATAYALENRIPLTTVRLDFIAIDHRAGQEPIIEHFAGII